MDFRFSDADLAFREEVITFLNHELPPGWADLSEGPAEDGAANEARWQFTRQFHHRLADRGWLTLGWPVEHGGGGAGPVRQALFNETMAHHRAPTYNQGVDRVGPTLIMYGSDQQKEYFLPRIRNADIQWCQGFSEPGSGSDLASLQTRAQRDGDDYIINGQKIWTSGAQHADWIFMLARTEPDAPKHRGISFFLIDMKTPGITVRPLVNMANRHHFNEVFFEDVRVPSANMVGEVNRGWYVATTTLDFERSGISRVVSGVRLLNELTELASVPGPDGRRPDEDIRVRNKLADLQIEFTVGRWLAYRVAWMQSQGLVPNHEASMSKLYGTMINQRLAGMINMFGLRGNIAGEHEHAPLHGRMPDEYLNAVPLTIAAGTSEIQRNIIATRGLGLPR